MIASTTKILIVDDSVLTQHMLGALLSELGFKTTSCADDGEEAIVKILDAADLGQPYEIMFLDWNMPKKTGYEVIEWCRSQSDPVIKSLSIVMVTAEAEKKHIFAALSAGADEYIVKPCTIEALQQKFAHLNKRRAQKVG